MDKPDDKKNPGPEAVRPGLRNLRDNDRAGSGGARDDDPGSPGGTRGTGGASEQDQ